MRTFGGVLNGSVPMVALPTQKQIVAILRAHKLVKLREKVKRAFLVGSFSKGLQHADSDVDILLEVEPSSEFPDALKLEDWYRRLLRQYFVKNQIRGKMDSVHPQWDGRRVDLYFTYDADTERRPKIQLESK